MHEPPRDIATLADRLAPSSSAAFAAIDQAVQQAHTQPGSRLIVTMPPQSGKTTRITQLGTLWAIAHAPDRRYALIAYSQGAAQLSAGRIADASLHLPGMCPPLLAHPRFPSQHHIAGHRGTLHTGATGSKNLCCPIDTLIVDDPAGLCGEPLSRTHADRIWDWWQTAALTRLTPNATVIVVETPRQHSLTSRLLADEPGRWTVATAHSTP